MKILNRYLVRTYLGMIATCLAAFVAIYLVVDFLERFGRFSRAGAPLTAILLYFLCKIPEIISQTAPMAVLMGTILAIGTLAKNSEITAMRSSGISLCRSADRCWLQPLSSALSCCSCRSLSLRPPMKRCATLTR